MSGTQKDPSFGVLVEMAHAEGLAVARALARTTAALGDGSAARPGERWQVDLAAARFVLTDAGGEVLFGGPCQLIGTYVEGDGFLWGFANSAIDRRGVERIAAALEGFGDLAPWLAQRSFVVDDEADARLVATWLAARAGYTGCFAAPQGRAIAYLAVQLTGPEGLGQGQKLWCSGCGTMQRAAKRIIAGPGGISLCDGCGATLGAMLGDAGAPPSDASPLPVGAWPTLRYCVFCGEPRPNLILAGSAGICRDCAAIVVDIFA